MVRKRWYIFFGCSLFLSFFVQGQVMYDTLPRVQAHIAGNIVIDLNEQAIQAELSISEIQEDLQNPEIVLNDILKVKALYHNGKKAKYSKTNKECKGCETYVFKNPIVAGDTLSIVYEGTLDAPKKDSENQIALQENVLRASSETRWLPSLFEGIYQKNTPFLQTQYSYDLNIECEDCGGLLLNSTYEKPQIDPINFYSEEPVDQFTFLAGELYRKSQEHAEYINFTEEQAVYTDSIVGSIFSFYESILGKPLDKKIFIANCPSPATVKFNSYPVSIFTESDIADRIGSRSFRKTLSEHIAIYYFTEVYNPHNELYYFYANSIPEYLSLKYINDNWYRKSYLKTARGQQADFVDISTVERYDQLSGTFRNRISPLTLVAIEKKVGEEKVYTALKSIFSKGTANPEARTNFRVFKNALLEAGVTNQEWLQIQDQGIRNYTEDFYSPVLKL